MSHGDKDLVEIGSGNGLLPDGTKPLPKPALIHHHESPVGCGNDLRALSWDNLYITGSKTILKSAFFEVASSGRFY